MSHEKIVQRIAKLLAMANDASSPNEALIAARRARALMDKYDLSENQINFEINRSDDFLSAVTERKGGTRPRWVSILHSAAGNLYDCEPVYCQHYDKVEFEFRGYKADALVAKLMFEYFIDACQRDCKAANLSGRSEYNFYRIGFASAVWRNVKAITEQREKELETSDGKSLVLCKKTAIKKHFGEVVASRPRPDLREPTIQERFALAKGRAAGSQLNLDEQLNADTKEAIGY